MSFGLVFRYNPDDVDEGTLFGEEGTFNICSFWCIEALAMSGIYLKANLLKALDMLDTILSCGTHTGLYAEQIGKHGEMLGNFPQAFTHLSLIRACLALDNTLNHTTYTSESDDDDSIALVGLSAQQGAKG